jgi:hypothetical protein
MTDTRNKRIMAITIFSLIIFSYALLTFALVAGDCNPSTGHIIGKDGEDTSTACYVYLEPGAFSGIKTQTTSSNNSLASFLGQIFNFGIAAAVALAFIMIVWGGIIYMTTDSWGGKEEGKTKVTDALYGLGLALISYLILYTINPCLVDFIGNKCSKPNTFLYPVSSSQKTPTASKEVVLAQINPGSISNPTYEVNMSNGNVDSNNTYHAQ